MVIGSGASWVARWLECAGHRAKRPSAGCGGGVRQPGGQRPLPADAGAVPRTLRQVPCPCRLRRRLRLGRQSGTRQGDGRGARGLQQEARPEGRGHDVLAVDLRPAPPLPRGRQGGHLLAEVLLWACAAWRASRPRCNPSCSRTIWCGLREIRSSSSPSPRFERNRRTKNRSENGVYGQEPTCCGFEFSTFSILRFF